MKRQQGFAILELVLIVVLVGIIAFVAWRVIEANGTVQTTQNSVPQTTATASGANPVAPLSNANDLSTLQTQLNNEQVNDNTDSQLSGQGTF